ncbi:MULTISPECIES: hypothetical protein [unclassified Roseitalea]|uniref:bestrophin-like domain n=1 Tax=unclassified Roseitalea TaxID=2639107 RepID=UPI00273DE8B1|nr:MULTISPECIES: hypothetical protein [unclassified Roseitalea]
MLVLVGSGFVLGTVALTVLSYHLARWLAANEPEGHTKDLASSVLFRVSALHGLILALVFAQELFEYQQLDTEIVLETNAVADVFFDAGRYGTDAAAAIQPALQDYVDIVVDGEWVALARTGQLDPAAWSRWDEAYGTILDLQPTTARQESLREHMLAQIHVVARTRDLRESHAGSPIRRMFWFAAIGGVVLIATAYHTFPPTRHNVTLLCVFGAFTGLILFFIYALANPYRDPGALEPVAYEQLASELANAMTEGTGPLQPGSVDDQPAREAASTVR